MTAQPLSALGDPMMPADHVPGDPNQVIWMGEGSLIPPAKTLTLTNNTDQTIYPFLTTPNNAEEYQDGSIYDPKDPKNEDYRGYIGYTGQDKQNYLGLPTGQTVTIPVPLVFWDGCRIFIASDGEFLTTDAQYLQPDAPTNPYQYYRYNQDGSEVLRLQQKTGNLTPSGLTGVVMWFHAKEAIGPSNDAPAQLVEFTIRDPWQLHLNPNLDKNTLGPLINYDVSYVDTIYLPIAMEATNAWILNDNMQPPYKTAPFGWIGALQTKAQFQQMLKNFTAADPIQNGLGQYFGGKGYTQYNLPADVQTIGGVKLPSGSQAIGDSPLQDKRSSYDSTLNLYLLDSGGTGPIEAGLSSMPNGTTTLAVTWDSKIGAGQKAALQYGVTQSGTMNVTCKKEGVIPDGTKLLSVDVDSSTVQLSNPATNSNPKNPVGAVVKFKRPVTDYVTTALLNLWYSWAKYYVDQNQIAAQTYSGSISSGRTLTFTNPVPVHTLVPGMRVTGPSIPTNPNGSFCTIVDLMLTPDRQSIASVTLSELQTGNPQGSYQFTAPQPVLGMDHSLVQTFPLTFSHDTAISRQFSQSVYQVMSAMSTIPIDPQEIDPQPMQLLYNVIGCNVGQIPNIGQNQNVKDNRIAGEIRDKLKSILRGVPDFTNPEFQESTGQWYPNPGTKTGGCAFNVYNLDPYVWFVHKQLGLSGYGFSVDDDVADVGARGATNLQISVGGCGGLPNLAQWSYGAQYGPVSSAGQVDPARSNNTIKNLLPEVFWQVLFTDVPGGLLGALVNGPGIASGTRVASTNQADHSLTLDHSFDPGLKPDTYTYTFYGPVTGTGQIDPQSPNKIIGLELFVLNQLQAIRQRRLREAVGAGIKVTGSGIASGTAIAAIDLANQCVVLNQNAVPQSAASQYTFS